MLLAMRYKNFTWPNNPKNYTLHAEKSAPVHQIPFGGFCVQELGSRVIELRGEGEFFGKDAYDDFCRLLAVFRAGGAGALRHPVWQCDAAYFTELSLMQEPRRDYVCYRFCFCQAAENTACREAAPNGVYIALPGDTLWHVCTICGVSMKQVQKLNPWLSSPQSPIAGKEIRIL